MENSRNFSRNKVGRNATVVLGNITVSANTPNADKSFLQAISKTDPAHDKNRILLLKGPLLWDAFNWIFGHQEFNKWRYTKESGVFWIKGDPGKGKTMLLCGIIEDLDQSPQNANLSYFFCQATDYRINTASAVVGGLIKSLLKRHPTLLSRIREKYADEVQDELDGTNALVILCDIFETITNDPDLKDIICVVDALDECITDCKYLLDFIVKTSGHVKWLLSSRNEKDIEKGLDQIPQRLVLELKDNAEKISTSIEAYIRHHIQEIKALKHDEELQVKTLDILSSKAQGTFLWVALVVEQLHDTDRWDIENVLEEVPKDLESFYGLILDRTERLGARGQEVCRVILSIIATAKRPLHLEELLIFTNSHWKNSSHFKNTYQLQDIQDMTKTCGSILSIREDTVYFIHQSAKDYVMENAAQRIFPILHQHYKMFEASLDAMSKILEYNMYCLEDPAIHIDDVPHKDVGSDPVTSIRYCCVFWVEHLVSGYQFEGFDYQKYLKDDKKLHLFLKEKFLCWVESLTLMRNFSPQAQIALQKLKDLIDCYCCSGKNDETVQAAQLQRNIETYGLRHFVYDAYRFVRNSIESVAHWPLQLYFSAISFEQHNTTIRNVFEQTVRKRFGPSPILTSQQHGQSSFRLQSSFKASKNDSISDKWLVFSPDSSLIIQLCWASSVNAFTVWRADTGTLVHTFDITPDSRIAFFPKSNDFISVSETGIIKRWSMNKPSCVSQKSLNLDSWSKSSSLPSTSDSYVGYNIPKARVVALSPNGDLVATWHRLSDTNLGVARIWDTYTACCHRLCEYGEAADICAAFSPNSQLLAVLYKDGIGVHNTTTGAMVQHLNKGIGQTETLRPPIPFLAEFDNMEYLGRILFSPNSKVLATVELRQRLYLWDTHKWELLQKIKVSLTRHGLRCLAISPDSAIVATGSLDGTKLWSIETGECVARVNVCPLLIAFPPDWTKSSLIVLQSKAGVIQTWLINLYDAITYSKPLCNSLNSIGTVSISPNSKFIVETQSYNDCIKIWSGDDGQLVHILNEESGLFDIDDCLPTFSPDSKLLACFNYSSKIRIWRLTTGKPIFLFKGTGRRKISSIALSNDPKCLIAGTSNSEICIWRIDSGQLIYRYDNGDPRQISERSLLVAISESAHVAATLTLGSWASGPSNVKMLRLCAAQSVEVAHPQLAWTRQLEDQILGLQCEARIYFSSDSAILASVTRYKAQIFDVTTGTCLQEFALNGIDIRLLTFDAIKGRILTTHSIFYKTSSWKHWQASPRLGYSHEYLCIKGYSVEGVWILLAGKRNCYLPSNFRPAVLSLVDRLYDKSTYLAMSESLLVVLNELKEVVIIKFPARREAQQHEIRDFDVAKEFESTTGSAGSSSLVVNAPAEIESGSELLMVIRDNRG